MINITEKRDCCGCTACEQSCPKRCISMQKDEEGFLYPKVDIAACVDCGACERVCPVIHPQEPDEYPQAFAAKNRDDETRRKSSSGGVFTLLAEHVINQGGTVFGVCYDKDWRAVHTAVSRKGDLYRLRGSKYMQSDVAGCYTEVRQLLREGRPVLFSGTPCQVAGLHLFLKKDYDNLLCVDIICHGVPSPEVFQAYLSCRVNDITAVHDIQMRDKITGWKAFSMKIVHSGGTYSAPFREDLFMRTFLHDLSLRPSCFHCPARGGRSGADITLADYWGVDRQLPEIDDDGGISLVLCHNQRAANLLQAMNTDTKGVDTTTALLKNRPYWVSPQLPQHRLGFIKAVLNNEKSFDKIAERFLRPSLMARVKRIARRLVHVLKHSR